VTITVTCYSWTPSSGDHLFTCGAIFWSPHYRLALIHFTCSWNLQSELKVTHENAPTALPRYKNVIFRHHYVMQKTDVVLQLRKVIFAKFFTSTAKTCW